MSKNKDSSSGHPQKQQIKPLSSTFCSPARYSAYERRGTCLDRKDVWLMVQLLLPGPPPRPRTPTRTLLRLLHDALGTAAGQESTWLSSIAVRQFPVLEKMLRHAFRPEHPKDWLRNPSSWLSTRDIDSVMVQYETSHPRFSFVGVFPRDFASRSPWTHNCVSPPMCELSVASLRERKKDCFGIVFNMDTHNESGSHWTACFGSIDRRNKKRFGIWYYDSIAKPPPAEIMAFMQRFAADVDASLVPSSRKKKTRQSSFPITINRVRRQFGDNECGMYSIMFIVICLTTRHDFDTICTQVLKNDDKMNALRRVIFRSPVGQIHGNEGREAERTG